MNYFVMVSYKILKHYLQLLFSKHALESVPYRTSISNNVIFVSGFHIYNKFRKTDFLKSITLEEGSVVVLQPGAWFQNEGQFQMAI